MITRVRKSMADQDKGFTLIELLVVIIIIGILSAIAIPVFLNQRKKAVDAGIKSDLRTIANEMETYFADLQEYPATVATSGGGATGNTITIGASPNNTVVNLSGGNVIAVTIPTAKDAYCIYGYNAKGTGQSTAGFTYDNDAGGLKPGKAAASAC